MGGQVPVNPSQTTQADEEPVSGLPNFLNDSNLIRN